MKIMMESSVCLRLFAILLGSLLIQTMPLSADVKSGWIESWSYDLSEGNLLHEGDAWGITRSSITSPAQGFQFAYPKGMSALKNFSIGATINKLDGGESSSAGIHLGSHRGIPMHGWNFLYTASTGEFRYEFRTPGNTTLLAKKTQKMNFPLHLNLTVDTNTGRWQFSANGVSIFDFTTGDLPVVWLSGVCSDNGTAEFSQLKIVAGDTWKPVVALGDSITHHCGWSQLVSERSSVPIGNAGMASDTSEGVGLRLESDAIRLHPKYAILFIGTNDPSSDTVYTNYPVIIDRLEKANIKPILCTALPRQGWRKIDEINAFIRKLAKDRQLLLVDWHDELQGDIGHLKPEYCQDGPVHPNANGVAVMASAFLADPSVAKAFQELKTYARP